MDTATTVIQKPNRILYLDILRFIAIFGVVLLHVSDDGFLRGVDTEEWVPSLVYVTLSHWILPMFVMISGALFLNPKKNVSKRDLFTKYILRLVLAYVFWVIAYTAIDWLLSRMTGGGTYLNCIFTFGSCHYWSQYMF